MLASMTSWLTPGSLFLFLNFAICTIFLFSRFTLARQPHNHQPGSGYGAPPLLARIPPFLKRVKSFNFSSSSEYTYSHDNYVGSTHDSSVGSNHDAFFGSTHDYSVGMNRVVFGDPATQPRAPSILERVKSISFTPYKFTPSGTESDHVSYPNPQNEAPGSGFQQPARAPTSLNRVKSFDFTSISKSDSIEENRESEFLAEPDNRSRSDVLGIQQRLLGKLKKSESANLGDREDVDEMERRRPESARFERTASIGEGGDVDANADTFISNFRLQRLKSSRRYTETFKSFDFASISRSDSTQQTRDPEFTPEPDTTRPGRVHRSTSDSLVIQSKLPGKLKKSGSENLRDREDVEVVERRRPESARFERTASVGEGVDVDAKADNFISHFRLQRRESFRRCEEM